MKEDRLEATPTVVEAVDRTEAILRGEAIEVRPARPSPAAEPASAPGTLPLVLDRWWARFTAWRYGAADPDL